MLNWRRGISFPFSPVYSKIDGRMCPLILTVYIWQSGSIISFKLELTDLQTNENGSFSEEMWEGRAGEVI